MHTTVGQWREGSAGVREGTREAGGGGKGWLVPNFAHGDSLAAVTPPVQPQLCAQPTTRDADAHISHTPAEAGIIKHRSHFRF
jgi:hypothetical protein